MNAMIDEQQRIEAALACIPPDVEREEWWRVGAAIKHELGDGGFDVFDAWSRGAQSYVAANARDTWRSLKVDGGITIGTLYGIARRYGFQPASHTWPVLESPQQVERRAAREAQAKKAAMERVTKQREASTLALAVWTKANPSRDDHPYLMRKGLKATPMLRELDAATLRKLIGYAPNASGKDLAGRVLVARIERDGKLMSLEMIDSDGRKSALAGGAKAGGYWMAAQPGADTWRIAIGEGVASAQTHQEIYAADGDAAVASLTAGNLRKTAEAMREAHPDLPILILGEIGNGSSKALEAAQAVGGRLVMPDFGDNRPEGATDINDLFVLRGVDAVRACVVAARDVTQPAASSSDSADDSGSFPGIEGRPCWRVYSDWIEIDGKRFKPGVYHHGVKLPKGDAPPELTDQWICSPLYVRAVTRNPQDGDYGRLLEYVSPAGRWKKWSMPMLMLAGDGNEVRGVLLSEGVMFDLKNRGGILDYIAGQYPPRQMRAAVTTGWCGDAFVLPDDVLGADDIWFQSTGREAPYAVAGTFEGWRELAALANDNPLLMFAMSTAFAGPLLGPLNLDGGGAHLYGDSSCGKTTAARAAISVWGSPRFERKWRATSNGLEGSAALHSDTLLVLDEIGEIKPQDLYETAYALINGMGKTRANRHGEARQAARWRVFLFSTGELTVAARMAAGGIEAKAGQLVRILDIPVTGAYGVFETLHGRESGGVLSDEIRNMAATNYGHAGPRFVDALIRNLAGGLRLTELLTPLLDRFGKLGDQERRAARAFALCALAGELAIEWGVVPWTGGEPASAALHAFRLWRSQWGAPGRSAEHAGILRAAADFIDRHGSARFSNIDGSADLIRDRAGWWKQDDGERRLYLFTSGGLREATKGYDFNRVLRAIDEAKAFTDKGKAEVAKVTHTPEGKKRLYHVAPDALNGGDK
ncbi:DUF927 domain-containing protein [Paraburkholderia adhaesiva]|uniref:DUF927 domain-containing protein n=1 Tax=Paraburkholderia adhaesiva TaxID=2883244 RepID=UPI001F2E7B0F|nr:DUF927 domain-containing protein [Paraburkholderia adhaesiva]